MGSISRRKMLKPQGTQARRVPVTYTVGTGYGSEGVFTDLPALNYRLPEHHAQRFHLRKGQAVPRFALLFRNIIFTNARIIHREIDPGPHRALRYAQPDDPLQPHRKTKHQYYRGWNKWGDEIRLIHPSIKEDG